MCSLRATHIRIFAFYFVDITVECSTADGFYVTQFRYDVCANADQVRHAVITYCVPTAYLRLPKIMSKYDSTCSGCILCTRIFEQFFATLLSSYLLKYSPRNKGHNCKHITIQKEYLILWAVRFCGLHARLCGFTGVVAPWYYGTDYISATKLLQSCPH
jgi:hypothetical protein